MFSLARLETDQIQLGQETQTKMTEEVKLCRMCELRDGNWKAVLVSDGEEVVKAYQALGRGGVVHFCSGCRRVFEAVHGFDACQFYCVREEFPREEIRHRIYPE